MVEECQVLCYAAAEVPSYFLAVGVGYVPMSSACEEVVGFCHERCGSTSFACGEPYGGMLCGSEHEVDSWREERAVVVVVVGA